MSSDRRSFLQAAAGAAAVGVWTSSPARARIAAASEMLNIGAIGVGGRGAGDLAGVAHENVVAICDVDEARLDAATERAPRAEKYIDYRKLMERDDLDAVIIGTPDHHHAPAAARALRRGLHVYCEKPLTHTVAEARLLRELAAEAGVATQMGTQGHAFPGYLRTVELLNADAIGPVSEVHVITDRPGTFWEQGLTPSTDRPPVPSQLHWDLWLGPAAERPYSPQLAPFAWRGWWDFGCGAVGDMAIHLMDVAMWGLDLVGRPVRVTSIGGPRLAASGPIWMTTCFEFAASDERPSCKVYWYEGLAQPPKQIAAELPMNGTLFVGERGRLAIEHGEQTLPMLLPEEQFADYQRPAPSLPDSPGHHQEWINACKEGTPTGSNFAYAGPFTEVVLLANVAFRAGRTVNYDPATGTAGGDRDAEALLSKTYRRGWEP